jgi:hypothetical protein
MWNYKRTECPHGCYGFMNVAYIQKRVTEHYGVPGKLKNVAVGLYCERCGRFIKIIK